MYIKPNATYKMSSSDKVRLSRRHDLKGLIIQADLYGQWMKVRTPSAASTAATPA